MGYKSEITKIHYNKDVKGLFFQFLKFCSVFYGLGSAFKNKLYDKNVFRPKKVNAYVISVGNITTGGVGKTPVVAEISNYLTKKGEKVAIISRGYGSKLSKKSGINIISDGSTIFYEAKEAGDEPFWLAENTNAIVITTKNRLEGAKLAIQKFSATKIILDDGFQHRKMHRDLDLVLIDSEMGFGNENLLPAGPLREGKECFARMSKLIVVSKSIEHQRAQKYAKIMGKKLKVPALVCYSEPGDFYNIFNIDEKLNPSDAVIAFCAIGQPKQFYAFINNPVEKIDFDDHHEYSQDDADMLVSLAHKHNVKNLLTTEKDASKLSSLNFSDIKVFALKLSTQLDVEELLNV